MISVLAHILDLARSWRLRKRPSCIAWRCPLRSVAGGSWRSGRRPSDRARGRRERPGGGRPRSCRNRSERVPAGGAPRPEPRPPTSPISLWTGRSSACGKGTRSAATLELLEAGDTSLLSAAIRRWICWRSHAWTESGDHDDVLVLLLVGDDVDQDQPCRCRAPPVGRA